MNALIRGLVSDVAVITYLDRREFFRVSCIKVDLDAGFHARAKEIEGARFNKKYLEWEFPEEHLNAVAKVLRDKHGIAAWHRPLWGSEMVPVEIA